MNRAEFLALTIPEQLATIWQMLQEREIPISGPPAGGDAPKWDRSIPRKDGMVQWASECSAKELRYWIDQANKPPRDPKYAEANQKQAKALGYFLSWRLANPDALWTGERNKVQVTAAAPSDKPQQYPKGVVASAPTTPTPRFTDDDDIPF